MKTITRVAFLSLFAAGVARAEDACQADVQRLCAGILPGGGRILACLKANEAQVSPACKAQIRNVAAALKEVGEACEPDVMTYCPTVPKGKGRVARCLAANEDRLSPPCREIVQGLREKASDFKQACGGDAARFCKGIPPGQGRILACLQSKKAELSPRCQPFFSR